MRLPRKLGGLLAAALMAAGLTAAAAPVRASTPVPYWQIFTLAAGTSPLECLQGDFGGPLGTIVTQQPCDLSGESANQQWLPIPLDGNNGYKFENAATQMCLEARFGAVNAQPVALWFCNSTESNTRWFWGQSDPGPPFPDLGTIQSRVSGSTGFCLDIPGGSSTFALTPQLFHCNGTTAQLFMISVFE
jgi:hypothetical protein